MEQVFDRDSLQLLRAALRELTSHAGLPFSRASDVVLAVHELAANAVCHGGGRGRLRVWQCGHILCAEISDRGTLRGAATGTRTGGAVWHIEPGHGLWAVRQIADQTMLCAGPHGTTATIRFAIGPVGRLPPFHLTRHTQGGCIVVTVSGHLVAGSARQFVDGASDVIAAVPAAGLVLDLSGLTRWDSSGLAALMAAQENREAHQPAKMIITSAPTRFEQSLRRSGLTSQFARARTVDGAIREMARKDPGGGDSNS